MKDTRVVNEDHAETGRGEPSPSIAACVWVTRKVSLLEIYRAHLLYNCPDLPLDPILTIYFINATL